VAEERVQRKLTTILAADVEGYSRLMSADEEATLKTLKTYLEIIDGVTAKHDGRLVGTAGDAVLVEFGSTVEAVRCAMSIQEDLVVRNAELAEDRRMRFRIGINVGDVMVEGDDLFGDGVNVAARLEGLAEPGGICISGSAFDQVKNKLSIGFEDIGLQEVKNIAEPVKAFRVRLQGDAAATSDGSLPLPDKPSIAVLPFQNMSGDSEQEYFSDGTTEDIITALSRIRQFFVIARNTTFTYKGRAVDVQAVASELGVRYVLEGSVRKAGNRVRISVQLIDGETGSHIWAERYDRDLEDIFALQDQITEAVAGAIEPEIAKAEITRARSKPADNLDAWEVCQRGSYHFHRFTRDDFAEAERLFRQAIARDPNLIGGLVGLARTLSIGTNYETGELSELSFSEALEVAWNAVGLDAEDPTAQAALGFVLMGRAQVVDGRYGDSIAAFERALALNPNDASAHFGLGRALSGAGEGEAALGHLATALRLSPRDQLVPRFYTTCGRAHFALGDYEAAVEWMEKARRIERTAAYTHQHLAIYIAALAHLGRDKEACNARDEMLKLFPNVTCAHVRRDLKVTHVKTLIDGLRKAGLPE
jgi:adenylate cyclase